MSTLLEQQIESSECFGYLYDGRAKACGLCEAWHACQQAFEKNLDEQSDEMPAWLTGPERSETAPMPVFREKTLEELGDLLRSFGDDPGRFERFGHPKIKRMRMTETLKRYYTDGGRLDAVCDTER